MRKLTKISVWSAILAAGPVMADGHAGKMAAGAMASDAMIAQERILLQKNTEGRGFGPQSPRDIDSPTGTNTVAFGKAPHYSQMNLCNIHFHKHAEHKGGEFTTYAGNGDGHGYGTGFRYSGNLTKMEKSGFKGGVCPSDKAKLFPGDTIELHYVHSSAEVQPGPTLGACISESIKNPQLRVETQVFVLVNDENAPDFRELTATEVVGGKHQAPNIPQNTGIPVTYAGSTTGPGYNKKGSPFQVTWNVRPKVAKVHIGSVGEWCQGNVFDEDHAHGVRNLVTNPQLLSPIKK